MAKKKRKEENNSLTLLIVCLSLAVVVIFAGGGFLAYRFVRKQKQAAQETKQINREDPWRTSHSDFVELFKSKDLKGVRPGNGMSVTWVAEFRDVKQIEIAKTKKKENVLVFDLPTNYQTQPESDRDPQVRCAISFLCTDADLGEWQTVPKGSKVRFQASGGGDTWQMTEQQGQYKVNNIQMFVTLNCKLVEIFKKKES